MLPPKPDVKISKYAQALERLTITWPSDYSRKEAIRIGKEGWPDILPELDKIAANVNKTLPKYAKPISFAEFTG